MKTFKALLILILIVIGINATGCGGRKSVQAGGQPGDTENIDPFSLGDEFAVTAEEE
jgi:hypothetical protein